MYSFLNGKLVEKGRDRVNIMTDDGVGYEVFISQNERSSFPATGERLTLYTHLHVREDNLQLFGFLNRSTRDFFRDLLPRKGIGPRLAISILSDLGADQFRKAVHRQDTETLTQVKGVGQKTAKRLIVEMAEKIPHPTEDGQPVDEPIFEEAVQALRGLGFSKDRASGAIRKALKKTTNDEPELESILSRGLEVLEGE